jgi:hypothetical protein
MNANVPIPNVKNKPKAGDVCAMQFRDGKWGCFVIAHVVSARGYMDFVVYGMDVVEPSKQKVAAIAPSLTRHRGVTWERAGAIGIFAGEYSVVGRVDNYSRENWPVPPQDGRGVPRHVVYVGYKDPKNWRMTKCQVLPESIQKNFQAHDCINGYGIRPGVQEVLRTGMREYDLGGDWLDDWVKYIPILDKQRCVPGF